MKFPKILLLIITILIAACSSGNVSKIKNNDFAGYSSIEKGESVKLKWDFANADVVRIKNLGAILNGSDSVTVSPLESTSYEFLVLNEADTLKMEWKVQVLDFSDKEPGKGITRFDNPYKSISFLETEYLSGKNTQFDFSNIKNIKAVRKTKNDDNTLVLRLIAMDEFGNYLPGIKNVAKELKWVVEAECSENHSEVEIQNFKENIYEPSSDNIDLSLLIENSVLAGEQFPVMEYIESFVHSLDSNDRVRLDYFNHLYEKKLSLREADRLKNNPKLYDKSIPGGLNAMYKAGYQTALDFTESDMSSAEKIMIIISFSPDNASIIYKANDIVEIANKKSLPVYTIGIGSAVESYVLKYIADATGGRHYFVEEEDIDDLPYVLREIVFSQKAYYEVNYTLKIDGCQYANMAAGVNKSNVNRDKFKVYNAPEAQYSDYQAIAAFEEKDTVVSEDYFPNIRSLARVLGDNPDAVVELIGNSAIEGNYSTIQTLSLKRAQAVRRLLIDAGAAPGQIRVRGEGAAKPLYYFQEREWQKYFNRRVEVRWLDPELLPFEIIADIVNSEFIALEKVESWENAGYRAYYERYLINNMPAYRVKLWGYATEEQAEAQARQLENKYKITFVVQ